MIIGGPLSAVLSKYTIGVHVGSCQKIWNKWYLYGRMAINVKIQLLIYKSQLLIC